MAKTTIPTGGIADDAVTAAKVTGLGKIAQVQYATTETTTTTNSTSYVDATNLTLNITPTAATSKIMCIANCGQLQAAAADLSAISVAIIRGTTNIYETINYLYQTNDDAVNGNLTLTTVDEPDTTSATTYKIQIRNRESNNVQLNAGGDSNSSITLMEILA
jgi:hypothetical protein